MLVALSTILCEWVCSYVWNMNDRRAVERGREDENLIESDCLWGTNHEASTACMTQQKWNSHTVIIHKLFKHGRSAHSAHLISLLPCELARCATQRTANGCRHIAKIAEQSPINNKIIISVHQELMPCKLASVVPFLSRSRSLLVPLFAYSERS